MIYKLILAVFVMLQLWANAILAEEPKAPGSQFSLTEEERRVILGGSNDHQSSLDLINSESIVRAQLLNFTKTRKDYLHAAQKIFHMMSRAREEYPDEISTEIVLGMEVEAYPGVVENIVQDMEDSVATVRGQIENIKAKREELGSFTKELNEKKDFEMIFTLIDLKFSGKLERKAFYPEITDEMEQAISRGLDYLVGRQNYDGSFGPANNPHIALYSALAGLALLAHGHTPSDEEAHGSNIYQKTSQRVLDFYYNIYLGNSPNFNSPSGDKWYIAREDEKKGFYGHGLSLLFLTQAFSEHFISDRRDKLLRAIKKALKLTVDSQVGGGWGYVPYDATHEGTLVVFQLQALRAARDIGISVNQSVILSAIEYLKKSAAEENRDGVEITRFRYQLGGHFPENDFFFISTSTCALNSLGVYKSDNDFKRIIEGGLNYLKVHQGEELQRDVELVNSPESSKRLGRYLTLSDSPELWYLSQLYSVQAMYQSGDADYYTWYPAIRDKLVTIQKSSGVWPVGNVLSGYELDPVYSTAIALLILSIPYKLLPCFQK